MSSCSRTQLAAYNESNHRSFDFKSNNCVFVCVDALRPSQHFFKHIRAISCLPRLNQSSTKQRIKCFAQANISNSGESRTWQPFNPKANDLQNEPERSTTTV